MLNMTEISEFINKQTGLDFSIADSVSLRTGRKAKRAYVKLGHMKLALMLIEVPESLHLKNEIKDIVILAEYERVIIYTSLLHHDEMNFLKENRSVHCHQCIQFYFLSKNSFHHNEVGRCK